jgi:hypothetical protein
MKVNTKILLIITFLSSFCVFNLVGFGKKETQLEFERIAKSPSGKYSYSVENKDTNYAIFIYEDINLLFSDNQLYRRQDRLFIAWHEEYDILWLYSGDIGTYYFYLENEKWNKGTFSDGRMKEEDIPVALKNAVPRLKNYSITPG